MVLPWISFKVLPQVLRVGGLASTSRQVRIRPCASLTNRQKCTSSVILSNRLWYLDSLWRSSSSTFVRPLSSASTFRLAAFSASLARNSRLR